MKRTTRQQKLHLQRQQQQRQHLYNISLLTCLVAVRIFWSWTEEWQDGILLAATNVRNDGRIVEAPQDEDQPQPLESSSTAATTQHGYPLWGDPKGIDLAPLVDYMQEIVASDNNYIRLFHHSWLFPETPYIVNASGVYTNHQVLLRVPLKQRKDRWDVTHLMFQTAWEILMTDDDREDAAHRKSWPLLRETLRHGSLPFVVWYGDNRKCLHNNYLYPHNTTGSGTSQQRVSLPIFTACAPSRGCNYTFPLPSWETFRTAQPKSWKERAANYTNTYGPWRSKIPQIFWRGSLYHARPEEALQSARWRLLERVTKNELQRQKELLNNTNATPSLPPVNAKVHRIYTREINTTSVGGDGNPIIPMLDYQKYQAILDMDGMSWSSRFVELLCYTSVIIKVEPEFVDYFFAGTRTTHSTGGAVLPWVHYIPVRSDLSDWESTVAYVLDPQNADTMERIIANANAWCHERLVDRSVAMDVLDMWEAYVGLLQQHSPAWEAEWQEAEPRMGFDLDVHAHVHEMYPYLEEVEKEYAE